MTKQLIFCLMVVLLFATAGLSQSRRKGPIRKSATVYYQSEESGSYTGTIHFKLNGKAVDFTWWRELTRWYNINDNPRARKVGAEWQIVYESCNDPECRKLVSARFTGRTDTSSPTVPSEGAITQGVRTISTPTGTWDDFWMAFRLAVNNSDRTALRKLMASSFSWPGEGAVSPDVWLRSIDGQNVWNQVWRELQQSAAKGTKTYKDSNTRNARQARITNDNSLIFQLGTDGKWRWIGFLGD